MDYLDGDNLEPGQGISPNQEADLERPRLWNPNAAALWSLLFTPAFGAFLHAANWRTLGNREHVRINNIWIVVTFIFLAVNIGTLFVPETKLIENIFRVAGIALLIGWYTTAAKAQVEYVKEVLGNHYVKRGWGLPLLIGLASVAAYFGMVLGVVLITDEIDPDDLAAMVKPLILEEWHKEPDLRDATIQKVTLKHQGGNVYAGFIDARLGGVFQRLSLQVTHDGETIEWSIKPLEEK